MKAIIKDVIGIYIHILIAGIKELVFINKVSVLYRPLYLK
jgi:hypothetical protein